MKKTLALLTLFSTTALLGMEMTLPDDLSSLTELIDKEREHSNQTPDFDHLKRLAKELIRIKCRIDTEIAIPKAHKITNKWSLSCTGLNQALAKPPIATLTGWLTTKADKLNRQASTYGEATEAEKTRIRNKYKVFSTITKESTTMPLLDKYLINNILDEVYEHIIVAS